MPRDYIVWVMPVAVGIRIQNAYIVRNCPDLKQESKLPEIARYADKEKQILKEMLTAENYKDWSTKNET